MFRALLDLVASQLDFDERVAAVLEVEDGVGLEPVAIATAILYFWAR